ncbi:MAG: DNA gyrase subunit A, partial [bacterium]
MSDNNNNNNDNDNNNQDVSNNDESNYNQYDKIINTDITERMKNSYMEYAMSVIVSRALPDVRDGLKPVHRRILYAMSKLNLEPSKAYKKCASIVGET